MKFTESFPLSGNVDRNAGVIRGVKICGLVSKWGYEYSADALRNAAKLYEGRPVNVNHPSRAEISGAKARESRNAYDRSGVIKNVGFVEGKGLYGDYHFLKTHRMADPVCEDAERGLGAFGFSHVAHGSEPKRQNGKRMVESISSVESVDLVGDPATNSNLFEGHVPSNDESDEKMSMGEYLRRLRSGRLLAESRPAAPTPAPVDGARLANLREQAAYARRNGQHAYAESLAASLAPPRPAAAPYDREKPGQAVRRFRKGA